MAISFLRAPLVLQKEDFPKRAQACGAHCAHVVCLGGGMQAAEKTEGSQAVSLAMFRKHPQQQSKLLSQDHLMKSISPWSQLTSFQNSTSLQNVCLPFKTFFPSFFLTNPLIFIYLHSKSKPGASLAVLDVHLPAIVHC